MKETLTLIFTALIGVSNAQQFSFPEVISEVVNVDSATAKQLFNRARSYFATEYKSAKDVVQYENADEGKIIGKGTQKISGLCFGNYENGYIEFQLTIETKDGRYKYSIDKVYHQALQDKYTGGYVVNDDQKASKAMLLNSCWKKVRMQALADMNDLAKDLKKNMATAANDSKDDW